MQKLVYTVGKGQKGGGETCLIFMNIGQMASPLNIRREGRGLPSVAPLTAITAVTSTATATATA